MDNQMSDGIVYLMYHEIERAGRELCEHEQGYIRYVVSESVFRDHLARLQASGFQGVSVSEALPGLMMTNARWSSRSMTDARLTCSSQRRCLKRLTSTRLST